MVMAMLVLEYDTQIKVVYKNITRPYNPKHGLLLDGNTTWFKVTNMTLSARYRYESDTKGIYIQDILSHSGVTLS